LDYQNQVKLAKEGKYPPRNPMTICSSREPNLKETEIGEGYSLDTVRQLEYTPRV
jgi:hypothetical protein